MNVAIALHVLVHYKPYSREISTYTLLVIFLYYIKIFEICLVCKFEFTNVSLIYGDNMPLK